MKVINGKEGNYPIMFSHLYGRPLTHFDGGISLELTKWEKEKAIYPCENFPLEKSLLKEPVYKGKLDARY